MSHRAGRAAAVRHSPIASWAPPMESCRAATLTQPPLGSVGHPRLGRAAAARQAPAPSRWPRGRRYP